MDFMILALDQIVNQAAKWRFMMGGNASTNLTIRSIINRGGNKVHNIPSSTFLAITYSGLIVLMPSTVQDAYDLLISGVKSNNPVVYIDDRWLYDLEASLNQRKSIKKLTSLTPKKLKKGEDLSIIGCGYGTKIAIELSESLRKKGITSDVIDLRILNPMRLDLVYRSVKKTKKIVVIDPGWKSCSISSEIIASLNDEYNLNFKSLRFNLYNSPAPTSKNLEKDFYFNNKKILNKILKKLF